MPMLFGWTMDQWKRAFNWYDALGLPKTPVSEMNGPHWKHVLVRNEWIARGGPASGPSNLLTGI